jgi:DNA repair protein SbcC/Rad50
MKFLQLEILNLASLDKQGGEVINFEEGALGESTIFSIVGPTGSGKSTLLDAICLALYNRAPRYPRKKGDKNQNIEIFGAADASESNRLAPTDSRNILTRGKKEGYSKLTFLANNGSIYRAEWHVRFQRVRYENAKTALYKITRNGEEITEEAADWNELPNIIGLDYDQFLRTVLIAQGSFANFLTAKENERYELLEKLIGCEETYTNIATEIKKAKDQATDAYNQMAASVEAVKQNLLNDEELAQLKEEIDRLEKAEKELDSQLKAISKDLQWFEESDKQIKQIAICRTDMEQAADAIKAMQVQILRLQLHDEVQPAVNQLQEVERQTQSIHEQEENILKAEGNIKSQESAIDESEKTLASLKEAVGKAQEQLEKALPVIAEARALKTKMEAAMPNLKEKKEALELAQKENLTAQKDVEGNARNIQKWEAVASTTALYQSAEKAHQQHLEHQPTQTRDALLAVQQEYQERSQRNELIAANARMQNHQEAMKQLGDKAGALQLVTQEKDDWTAITDAIGADGKTLRKIAQCYTLSFLIAHANQEIRKFNTRYELQQVKHSLGIRVIDHDRADDIRDTTSLSGGETFIVSLGLALGLSALSSRNISFENLFIDEGFGTLDPDTLATVIDSLAMLQSSQGKKVGVISHTDTMSERITTQIRIIKNGNSGSSHIEIYP